MIVEQLGYHLLQDKIYKMPYAFVENGLVADVRDSLPENWRNISNFYVHANNYKYLNELGWYAVQDRLPNYDPTTQKLDNWSYEFDGVMVHRVPEIINVPQPTPADIERANLERVNTKWQEIRILRDDYMKSFEWRYTRYQRQVRLGITTTDNIDDLDNYMQELADITLQSDPFKIVWPVFTGT